MPKDAADLMQFLPSIALFGGLEPPTLERIIGMLTVQQLEPGTEVCKQGEAGRSMFVVRSGEAVVQYGSSASARTQKIALRRSRSIRLTENSDQ